MMLRLGGYVCCYICRWHTARHMVYGMPSVGKTDCNLWTIGWLVNFVRHDAEVHSFLSVVANDIVRTSMAVAQLFISETNKEMSLKCGSSYHVGKKQWEWRDSFSRFLKQILPRMGSRLLSLHVLQIVVEAWIWSSKTKDVGWPSHRAFGCTKHPLLLCTENYSEWFLLVAWGEIVKRKKK